MKIVANNIKEPVSPYSMRAFSPRNHHQAISLFYYLRLDILSDNSITEEGSES